MMQQVPEYRTYAELVIAFLEVTGTPADSKADSAALCNGSPA